MESADAVSCCCSKPVPFKGASKQQKASNHDLRLSQQNAGQRLSAVILICYVIVYADISYDRN